MIRISIVFLLIAILAASIGFSHVPSGATSTAKILFLIFIELAAIFSLLGLWIFKKKLMNEAKLAGN